MGLYTWDRAYSEHASSCQKKNINAWFFPPPHTLFQSIWGLYTWISKISCDTSYRATAEDYKLRVRSTSHFENRTSELGVRNNHAWTNLHKPWVNMRALLKLCVMFISSLHAICVNIAILHTILSKFTHFVNLHKNECWINTLHVYKITYTHFA